MIDYDRSRVEKPHPWDLWFVPSLFKLVTIGWITWDRAGPLGGKCRTIGWGGRGVVLASRHLQGCNPCLCQLRINGLAPTSKYWMYRSHTVDRYLAFITASMAVLREKLGGVPTDHSARLGVVSGALFLGSNRVRPMLWMACKRLPHMWTTRRKHTLGIHGLAWEAHVSCVSSFPLQGVHRFESLWLSDMSNCLSRGSLHVANLIA
jgi:hypothetical protein